MDKNSKIYVAGHRGLLGTAVCKKLNEFGYCNIITRAHSELDLLDQKSVYSFFDKEKPDYVVFAAAFVGGIGKNAMHPAPFIYDNVMMGFNVVEASRRVNVKRLINVSSACIYPKNANQPIKESCLMTGELDPTHEAYAHAKISVLKLCEKYNIEYGTNFFTVVPNNLYGPNDNYGEGSHVLPALIRRFHEAKINSAKEVTIWGDGTARREFLYSEDLAEAIIFLLEKTDAKDLLPEGYVNVGYGRDYSISEVVEKTQKIIYGTEQKSACKINWDTTKPNGVQRRICDISKLLSLGYKPHTDLEEGILKTYNDFLNNGKKR